MRISKQTHRVSHPQGLADTILDTSLSFPLAVYNFSYIFFNLFELPLSFLNSIYLCNPLSLGHFMKLIFLTKSSFSLNFYNSYQALIILLKGCLHFI